MIRSALDYIRPYTLRPFRQFRKYNALTTEHRDSLEGVVRCHNLEAGDLIELLDAKEYKALTPEHSHSLEKHLFLDRLYDAKDVRYGDLVVAYSLDGDEDWLESHPNEPDKTWYFICGSGIVASINTDINRVSGFWVKIGSKIQDYKLVRELPYKAVDAYTKGNIDPTLYPSDHKFLILSRRANEMTVEEIKGIVDNYAEEFGTWGTRLLVDKDNNVINEG